MLEVVVYKSPLGSTSAIVKAESMGLPHKVNKLKFDGAVKASR